MIRLHEQTTVKDTSETDPRFGNPRRRLIAYLSYVLLIPALLYPFAFFIVTRPNYERWSASPWGPALEYAFTAPQQDAEVVIFGDSSAFLGIDPRLVDRALGTKSIVLPDTSGSIPVTGDKPLDVYLAHHRAPRVIVLYFSPWNLEFNNVTKSRLFEGEEMMLRHMSGREIAVFTVHHPTELLVFPFRLYSTFGPKIIRAALHHVDRGRAISEARGHVDFSGSFPEMKSECEIPAQFVSHSGTASIAALVARYRTRATQVMVYVAPIPECRNSGALLSHDYASLGARPPTIMPRSAFVGDGYYAHIDPPSVPLTSALVARALREQTSLDAPLEHQ